MRAGREWQRGLEKDGRTARQMGTERQRAWPGALGKLPAGARRFSLGSRLGLL